MIKCLMDKFCCKLQPPLFHILLMQPNINPTPQGGLVGISHSELVLATSQTQSALLRHIQPAWLRPLPAPPMSPSVCLPQLARGDFQSSEHTMLFPPLEIGTPAPTLSAHDLHGQLNCLRRLPNPQTPLLWAAVCQYADRLLRCPFLLLIWKVLATRVRSWLLAYMTFQSHSRSAMSDCLAG